MKALFTFDCQDLFLRSWQMINFFKSLGYEPFTHNVPENYVNFINGTFQSQIKLIEDGFNENDYDVWVYDLTSWVDFKEKTKYLEKLRSFKGKLVCINYEDGTSFLDHRIDDYVIDKTRRFVRVSLTRDKTLYNEKIVNKLFLTTSYVDNSQWFVNSLVPFDKKIKRAFFSGSITGNPTWLTNFNKNEHNLRLEILKTIYDSKLIDTFFRIHNYDPSLKVYFDNDNLFKQNLMGREEYVKEFSNSLFILAIKGNGYNTNRFFESQSSGCVTLSNNMDEIEIYGIGEEGEDWIEFDINNNGILFTLDKCLNDMNFCKKICENGRKCWEKYNMIDTYNCFSKFTYEHHKKEFYEKL